MLVLTVFAPVLAAHVESRRCLVLLLVLRGAHQVFLKLLSAHLLQRGPPCHLLLLLLLVGADVGLGQLVVHWLRAKGASARAGSSGGSRSLHLLH